jgi:hypothetical protein
MSAEVQKESDLYTKKYFFIMIFGCEGLGPLRKGGGGFPLHSVGGGGGFSDNSLHGVT